MPYKIAWEEHGVHCKFSGKGTIQDLVAVFTEIGQDPRFDEVRYQIFDYSAIEEADVTLEQLTELAALSYAHSLTNSKAIKISVSDDPRIEKLIGHYISVNETPHKQSYCRTLQEARELIASSTARR